MFAARDADLLASRLWRLRLSSRARNCLREARCETVGDLCKLTAEDLLRLPNFGLWSLLEVREKLAAHGLALVDDDAEVSIEALRERVAVSRRRSRERRHGVS